MFKGPKTKRKKLIVWTEEQERFKSIQQLQKQFAAIELAHPDPRTELVLTTDASDAMGAVVEQRTQQGLQLLGFLSKKLSSA